MKKEKLKRKTVKKYIFNDFGFPIELYNVEFVFYKDEWLPKIDMLKLELVTAKDLSEFTERLSGNHIRFLRSFLNLSLRDFAERLNLSHVAIKKWEDRSEEETGMHWTTEVWIKFLVREKIRRIEGHALDSTERYFKKIAKTKENSEKKEETLKAFM